MSSQEYLSTIKKKKIQDNIRAEIIDLENNGHPTVKDIENKMIYQKDIVKIEI